MALTVVGTYGYQAWDAGTGKRLGEVIAPLKTGSYTAAAVSNDGRYLAAVFNEFAPGPNSWLVPYVVGEIGVWDLREKTNSLAARGRIAQGPHYAGRRAGVFAGSRPAGRVSDTGRRDGADACAAGRERPATPSNALKVLSLEAASPTPKVTDLEKKGIPLEARLEWPGDGTTLIFRNGREFDVCDARAGRSKAVFRIPFPASLSDPDIPAHFRRANRRGRRGAPNTPPVPSRPAPTRLAARPPAPTTFL